MRRAPNNVGFAQPVWLAFDPEHGKGERPNSFWCQDNLAASEVFSALIQFPNWPLAWLNGASAPTLTGYQLKDDYGNWSSVPYLQLLDDCHQLELCGDEADGGAVNWSSPSVRAC